MPRLWEIHLSALKASLFIKDVMKKQLDGAFAEGLPKRLLRSLSRAICFLAQALTLGSCWSYTAVGPCLCLHLARYPINPNLTLTCGLTLWLDLWGLQTGWRHWPCVWFRSLSLDLIMTLTCWFSFPAWPWTCLITKNFTSDSDSWLQLISLTRPSLLTLFGCCGTLVSETSACLVIMLSFWSPCPSRAACSFCSLIRTFLATDNFMQQMR